MKEKYYTYKLNPVSLNILCIIIFIPLFIINYKPINFTFISLILVVFWFILHEFIHGLGFMIYANPKNINYGVELEKGIFYCMCKERISKKGIMVALLLPLFIIGLFTYFIGIIFNLYFLTFLSIINIAGSVGDIVMSLFILKLPNDISYVDLGDTTSFTIISKRDLKQFKMIALKLEKTGDYKKATSKTNKIITISKISKVIFAIFLILSIIFLVRC